MLRFLRPQNPARKNPSQRQLYLGFPTAKPLVKDNYFRKNHSQRRLWLGFWNEKNSFEYIAFEYWYVFFLLLKLKVKV